MKRVGNCICILKIYSINMSYESFEEYQYNSCVSRGICSINPRVSSLQTVIVLYLRMFAKFAGNLDVENDDKYFILNTIATTINNPDFNEDSFLYAVDKFKKILPKFMAKISCNELEFEEKKAQELFENTNDIIASIKFGERVFNNAVINIPANIRDMYNIILIIAKSLSINLLDLESFEKNNIEAFSTILRLLSQINLAERDEDILKQEIIKASNTDINLMKEIRKAQEERYGKQHVAEVSYTTVPNKAVLVVGSNIRELETVLEALKDENIDVYTHDDMMLAHTFPKFTNYPNLKGQFGFGLESCLLDFATFPGPIVLTKHSLHNIENFYRGRLFTTDYSTSPKGIIKIENNDFKTLIESAKMSKGFKKGKLCETVAIGYDYEKTIFEIKSKISQNSFTKIFIIGFDGYSLEQKSYFEKLIKLAPKDVLIISFSYDYQKENLIYINSCFDNYSWIKLFEYLKSFNLETTFFIPKCGENTISQIIYLSESNKSKVFIGKCAPIVINPLLLNTLEKLFDINEISNSKKDLEYILEDK